MDSTEIPIGARRSASSDVIAQNRESAGRGMDADTRRARSTARTRRLVRRSDSIVREWPLRASRSYFLDFASFFWPFCLLDFAVLFGLLSPIAHNPLN